MTLRPDARSVRAAGAALLVLAGSLAMAACGAQQSPPFRPAANSCSSQIAQLERESAQETSTFGGGATLMAAALLSAKVVVEVAPGPVGPACTILKPGKTLNLEIGQKAVFEANAAPSMTGATKAVAVSTVPGTSAPPPLPTPHVIVTMTAVGAGTVNLAWTDCSGTGC